MGPVDGPKELELHLRTFRGAFPDLRFFLNEFVWQGELVASRMTITGRHLGPWSGFAPTGKLISVRALCFDRVRDGRLVAHWEEVNEFGLLMQLGLQPTNALVTGGVQVPEQDG